MKQYRVKPGSRVKLSDWDAHDDGDMDKDEGLEQMKKLSKRIDELQDLLFAEHKHKLLIVLQAMDTAGKDGTIRDVFDRVDPQGVRVANFKAPTPLELDHDYLWRVHQQTPGKGELVIFNRSHYEDVLIVRVRGLAPEKVWKRRFEHINDFERMLADEGTTIVKFYLHIDAEEQKERLQARLDDPSKNWKFNLGDLDERKLWPQYMEAYEDVLSKTSTEYAPWYIVPANRKWYRNLVVARTLIEALEGLEMHYPEPEAGLADVKVE